ncbi:MAG TPA: transglycosylase SLT domain-containing protein [Miltoncostaeaceae bacterium]|nr:transglycosylase SLT domain-containing protein [Miltoncostaeaceae bacterium]
MRAAQRERGQALPLALALALLLLLGAVALFALGRVQLAAARAQTAADLGAISAARELRGRLGEIAVAGRRRAGAWRDRLAAVAGEAARPAGARLEGLSLPGGSWPPTAVEVTVSVPGPRDARVRAVARAGLVVSAAVAAGEPTGWATGGGYSGPLVHRDGKPMCPAVGAAFDLMEAAASADGVDLVVVSGFRSDAEQAALFARHPDPRWVAPPGRSRHRDATELDLNMHDGRGGAYGWLSRNGSRFGFVQRYSWEPWHWGYLAGCGGGAPPRASLPAAAGAAALPGWVPARHRPAIAAAATANGIAPVLLAALLRSESGFDPRAVSPAGAQGIAQFMPATARGMGLRDPFDPQQAIPAAARLLGGHLRAFGSVPLALAAYHAGAGAVRRYGGVPPYRETQAYVARIMALAGGAGALAGGGGDVVLLRVGERFV